MGVPVSTVVATAKGLPSLTRAPTVLLEFAARWCHPCRVFAPVYEHVSDANGDIVFATVDVDDERTLAAHFEIASVPTLVALRSGVIVFRYEGVLSPRVLQSLVDEIRTLEPRVSPPRGAHAGRNQRRPRWRLSPW